MSSVSKEMKKEVEKEKAASIEEVDENDENSINILNTSRKPLPKNKKTFSSGGKDEKKFFNKNIPRSALEEEEYVSFVDGGTSYYSS